MIDELFERPADTGVSLALFVQRGDDIIVERYGVEPANAFQPERPLGPESTLLSWSMAKSMLHACVGMLVGDGLLDPEAPAAVPEWQGTDKATIRLIDLLEMRDGLDFVEDYVDDATSHCIEMLFGDSGPSHAAYAAARSLAHPPGTFWNYSSGTSNIVSRIVGDAIVASAGVASAGVSTAGTSTAGTSSAGVSTDETSTAADTRKRAIGEWLDARLFTPLGMDSAAPKFDGAGDFVGSSYVYATARDFAKFGRLYLDDGCTPAGDRLLPVGWVEHAATQVAVDPVTGRGYGRHWWLWPSVPDSIVCQGYEGQYIVVDRRRELVLVHLGKTPIEHQPALCAQLVDVLRRY